MTDSLNISEADLDLWTAEQALAIPLGPTINRLALLRALCQQESSYGFFAGPRHEDSWCPNRNGVIWRAHNGVAIERHRRWGCLACCSYGPLQALYHTLADAPVVTDPRMLLDPRYAFDKSVALLTRKLLREAPRTVEAVADMWNSGTATDAAVPANYITSVRQHYNDYVAQLEAERA